MNGSQETNPGCYPFLLHINDLPMVTNSLFLSLEDDIKVRRVIDNKDDKVGFQGRFERFSSSG